MKTSFWRKAVALPLAWVMAVTSLIGAAPPTAVFASPAPNPVPYVYVEPPLLALARAFEESFAATPEPALPSLPRRVAAFAFGADSFTRTPYTKVVQGGANFLYAASRGYGYTDVVGLDDTPNNRGVFSGPGEIYDQLTSAKPAGADIVFRADVPNGTYRFVAAGGDPKYGDHLTTVRVRDGGSGASVNLVQNFRNLNREFWRVGFEGNLPPSESALFASLIDSPTLAVTSGFVEIRQIAGTGTGINAGGDLNLIELWLVEEPAPAPTVPEGLVRAFAFGADSYTRSYYTKIVQDGANFLYSATQGFGYSDVSGLDTSPNNRGFLSGDAELYDQFIGAKPGGASIVFKVDLPNGYYRLVLAGGDVEFENHETTILARDGSDGKAYTLVDGLANPLNEFYRIGFEGKEPPFTNAVNFLPLSTSPVIEITKGFLEIHQIAGEDAGAGGDLCLLEIWQAAPVVPPSDLVAAFAFGADSYTRLPYTKVVQDGLNFLYDASRGYGYTNVSGLDTSPNNRGVLPEEDEIYDQFIGAKPAQSGSRSIVFRVDVPPGEYRFVAAGGDARYQNHKTTVRVRDGSSGSFVSLAEDLENPQNQFYRVGFSDKHAPPAASVNFLPERDSPTLAVTSGYLEVHQRADPGFAAGGDLSIFEIWRAGTVVPPSVAIQSPADGAFFTAADVPVRVTFTGGVGVAVLIDGVDRASELTLSPGVLEGTLAVADGVHEIAAGSLTHGFTVDVEPPVLTLDPTAPYVATTPLLVTGTMRDRDPTTVVDCPSVGLTSDRFTCSFPLTEGANTLTVTATDRAGRQASASASVVLDTRPPELTILSPTPDTYTMAGSIDVTGGVFDDSPVTVRVDAVDALVNGTTFTAAAVPVSAPSSLLRVVATDAAGNTGEAAVTVFFDAEPPLVTLSSPVGGAILPSPVTVTGTVSDLAPVVLVDVNGQPVMVENGAFTTSLTAVDGPLAIVATARDAAGNPGTAEVAVTVDSTAPVLAVTSPADGAVTNVNPVSIQGAVTDATPVSLTLNGAPAGSGFPLQATLTEGANPFEIAATDAAGNSSSVSLGVVLDTQAPLLQIVSPSEGETFGSLPVLVQGTVRDATEVGVVVNGVPAIHIGEAWQVAFDLLPEGSHAFNAVATDAAGNSTASTVSALLDTTAPLVAITSPATGLLTREASVDVTGTEEGAVSVTVNGIPATLSGGGFFATVALADGDNTIRVVATDAAGRSAEATVVVTQDAVPPTLTLLAPETISGITPGKVTAVASDNLALSEVVLRVNGETRGVFTGPPFEPFEIDLELPDGAEPGDTAVVSAEAMDTAGNRATTSRGVIVIEDGVIVGQVLDDTTSLPIEGASVTLGARTVPTDARGQYSLPTGDADVVIRVEKTGMTAVERRTSVLSDVGTVPVDARLTPLTGDLTEISPQGLPALLPLGWSPLSAFQVTGPTTIPVPDDGYLAQYRFTLHEWVMLSLEGPLDFEVPEAGSYALVVPDAEVSVPAPGEILEGVDVQILPASVTTESLVEPAVLPPSGGIAHGSLTVFSPVPLPSGTVIQAEITETFSLASGDVASEETRYEDIVLYRAPDGTLAAAFPITSSLTGSLQDVVSGEVNLDLLAGREAVRGVRGGSRALTVEQGDFRLAVPGSSLPEDTAISLRTFDSTTFDTLAEVYVDLSGQALSMGAELSMAADGLSPDDTYILARIVRLDGVPRMQFVSLATLAGDRLSAPGVREQGSFVFYRSFSPVGFVSGRISAPAAVVETAGLPFVSRADGAGGYRAVALTGPVGVSAFVPRTSLRAAATVDVLEGETTSLDLSLSGQTTTATVTPADGALGVAISSQIDVASSTPLAAGPSLTLLEGGAAIPVRILLSGSGRSLSVIPEDNLKYETTYLLEAATLADVFGGAVVVPETTFTTGSKEVLSADPEDVSFSLPDDNGIVEVSAFGLPPGTTVLLVNSGNGIVVSFTYVADGVLGEIPASISDRILVTLTDPAGSVVSFEKSKFTASDGTTAIGPGGGVVEGEGGVELRIPEGALPQGVTFNIRSVAASEFPLDQRPVLPGATIASGLEVQAPSMPQFEKEVKLAFPRPADAPEGAFFYVYRKHETPTGEILWETIDHAFVESDKVVTASAPFSGYQSTFGVTSLFTVVWTYVASRLDRASTGTVTGKVLRTTFQPGTAAPSFVPIPNILVRAGTGTAFSQEDGTYTLFDETFRDGIVRVRATVGDVTQEATAYAINVEDDGPSQLRFYENVATANLTFPPEAPRPPPPSVGVSIFKKHDDGSRERTDGLVVESDTLVIGFTTEDTIQQARINGQSFGVRREIDTGVNWVIDQDFTPGRPGTFLVETTALGADGSIADVAVTFRAIAAGGSNNDTLHDEAPSVITLRTVPKNNAKGVPVDVFPQVTFTEPVVNLPGNVSLTDSSGQPVGFVLSGVGPDGPIADVSSAGAKVTSLTLQPMTGLKFGEQYTLSLSTAIEDLDKDAGDLPAPKNLVPFSSSFTTFGPESLGGTDDRFGSAGIIVLEDRAFLVENQFFNGTLRAFDITDPAEPQEIVEAQASVDGRPVDLAGEPGTVVVATGPTNRSRPSNLLIFDVTSETESRWVGAASVASSAQDGFVQRVDLLDGLAYVLTGRKGVQIVNLQEAIDLFETETNGEEFSPGYFSVRQKLNTAGQGFGQTAVRQPIPLPKDSTRSWFQQDLSASRIQSDVWVGTTGEAPLLLVDTATRTASVAPVDLITGSAIELGQVRGRDLALIAGWGVAPGATDPGWAFAVVDLSQPAAPFTLGIISLPLETQPTDILLTEDVAIVASENEAALVNLADPAHPLFAGTIDMVGGVLALTDSGLLLSTARSAFGGDTDQGGVRTAALESLALITRPSVFAVDRKNKSLEPQELKFRIAPASLDVETAELDLYKNQTLAQTLSIPNFVNTGTTYTFPKGSDFDPNTLYEAQLVVNRGLGERERKSVRDNLRPANLDIVTSTNEEVVLSPDEDPVDVLKMFHSAPSITLEFERFEQLLPDVLPGRGEEATVRVKGTVVSAIAPIEKIVINENVTQVTPDPGSDGSGPFAGTYSAGIKVGPQTELITAYAVDALNHVSTQSVRVIPQERVATLISGRDVETLAPLVPGPQESSPFVFEIVLKDRGSRADKVTLSVDTGVETKAVVLERAGNIFRSPPLLALPENLALSAKEKATRWAVRLGTRPEISYGSVKSRPIIAGVNVVPSGGSIADRIDPASATPYVIQVGRPGTDGPTLSATLTSLDANMTPIAATSHPTTQTFALSRVGNDPTLPGFNLYEARGDESLLALMEGINSNSVAKRHGVVPLGRLKAETPGGDLTLPVGPGADRVRWETVLVEPVHKESFSDLLLSFFGQANIPFWWRVTQSAVFLRGDVPIEGLTVSGFLDTRTSFVNERTGVTALRREATEYVPTSFPLVTDGDGKITFRVTATAVKEIEQLAALGNVEPSTQPLAGVVLSLTDLVGIRAMELLAERRPATDQAFTDVTSENDKEFKTTTLVAGFSSRGGIPRRNRDWYRRLGEALIHQAIGDNPQYNAIRDKLQQGLTGNDIILSADEFEAFFQYFMLGAALGFPKGLVEAGGDSLFGIYQLFGMFLSFLKPDNTKEAILQGLFTPAFGPVTGRIVAKLAANPEIIADVRAKLDKMIPFLLQAVDFLASKENQEFMTALAIQSVLGAYQEEIKPFLTTIGLDDTSLAFRPFMFGYSVGAATGYAVELVGELVASSAFADAVGAVFMVLLKGATKAGLKGAQAIDALRGFTRALAAGDGARYLRALGLLLRFLDRLTPDAVVRWFDRIALIERGHERTFLLVLRYLDQADGAERLIAMAPGLNNVENVAETLAKLGDMADDAANGYRSGRAMIVSLENAPDVARAVGQAVDLSRAEGPLRNGFEAIFRNVEELEEFLLILAQGPEDAFRGAARLACPIG